MKETSLFKFLLMKIRIDPDFEHLLLSKPGYYPVIYLLLEQSCNVILSYEDDSPIRKFFEMSVKNLTHSCCSYCVSKLYEKQTAEDPDVVVQEIHTCIKRYVCSIMWLITECFDKKFDSTYPMLVFSRKNLLYLDLEMCTYKYSDKCKKLYSFKHASILFSDINSVQTDTDKIVEVWRNKKLLSLSPIPIKERGDVIQQHQQQYPSTQILNTTELMGRKVQK